jgi:TPR repeat protein
MNLLVLCADDYGCDDTSRFPQLLQRSAQLGYGDSCYDLALAFNEGKYGLEQDMEQVWNWFHRGAMCGHTESFYQLYLVSSYAEDSSADQTYMAFYNTDRLKDRMPAADWKRLAETVFEGNHVEWMGDYD